MKLSDILENKQAGFPKSSMSTLPGVISSPGMNQYYDYYRFLVAIAGFPDCDVALAGPISDTPLITPYTAIEQDHALQMLNKMGLESKIHARIGSHESAKRNTMSPVRRFVDPDESTER
jgi:hypothetical protein